MIIMSVFGGSNMSSGWKNMSPKNHERTVMRKKCGSRCFLGPKDETCFPICAKHTCKINKKGLLAAYIRGRQYGSKKMKPHTHKHKRGEKLDHHHHTKKFYNSIASKARKMLKTRGYTVKKRKNRK